MSDLTESWNATIVSAGIAGISSDIALHPLDTVKTRIQSTQGFWNAGGFRGLYKGAAVVTIGSAPETAMFFCIYEALKSRLSEAFPKAPDVAIHMTAATVSEVASCSMRVPTEVVKQRMQMGKGTITSIVKNIIATQGWRGLYTGFRVTIMREIPYSLIQFPMYEMFMGMSEKQTGRRPDSLEAAVYGSVSGAIAAGITTPLDVVKTRLMLAEDLNGVAYCGVSNTFRRIVREEGPRALLKGLTARVTWIGLQGFILFGAYEQVKHICHKIGFSLRVMNITK